MKGLKSILISLSLVIPAVAESKSGPCLAAAEHRLKFLEVEIDKTHQQLEKISVESCLGWTDQVPCDVARVADRNINRRKLIQQLEVVKADLTSYIKALRSLENSLYAKSEDSLADFYNYLTRGAGGAYLIEPSQMEKLVAHAQGLTASGQICRPGEALNANGLRQNLFKVLDKAPQFSSFSDETKVKEPARPTPPQRLPFDKRIREGEVKVCGVYNNLESGERLRLGCVRLGIKVLSIDREYVRSAAYFKIGDRYLPARSPLRISLLQTLKSGGIFPCHYVRVQALLPGDFLAEISQNLAANLKFRSDELSNLIEMFKAEVDPSQVFDLDVRTGGCGYESEQVQQTQLFLKSNDPRRIDLEFSTSLNGVNGWGDM